MRGQDHMNSKPRLFPPATAVLALRPVLRRRVTQAANWSARTADARQCARAGLAADFSNRTVQRRGVAAYEGIWIETGVGPGAVHVVFGTACRRWGGRRGGRRSCGRRRGRGRRGRVPVVEAFLVVAVAVVALPLARRDDLFDADQAGRNMKRLDRDERMLGQGSGQLDEAVPQLLDPCHVHGQDAARQLNVAYAALLRASQRRGAKAGGGAAQRKQSG